MEPTGKVWTAQEVAQHNHKDDCWVSYKGKVFDITNFSEDHPGGDEVLLEHAGQDITEAFHELHQHSLYASQLLQEFYIGQLIGLEKDETDSTQLVSSTINNGIVNRSKSTDEQSKTKTKTKNSTDEVFQPKNKLNDASSFNELELSETMLAFKDDQFLDFTQPLLSQLWKSNWSKRYYLEQIHIPRHVSGSPRFFHSAWLEVFTCTPWYGVLLFWVPIIGAMGWYGASHLEVNWFVHLLVDGLVLWTIYEYVFHRFLFHMDEKLPDHKLAQLVHFLFHGVHHLLPMDRYRLVMPPLMLSLFVIPVLSLWWWLVGGAKAVTLSAGALIGYLFYDMIHYYSHHGPYLPGYLQRMKTYHMDHHYVDPSRGFGVSSMVWDAILDTILPIRINTFKSK